MAENRDRILPYDLNAEAAVLSAMMIDYMSVIKSIEELQEGFFFNSRHKVIYKAMMDLYNSEMEIDLITLLDNLESKSLLEKAGGKDYIMQIADVVVSGANFTYHSKILHEKFVLRELILTSNSIIEKCYEGGLKSDELIDFAEQAVFKLYDDSNRKGFVRVNKHTEMLLDKINNLASLQDDSEVVRSGFNDLDDVTGGFRPGQLIVLAARPSMGKSALAVNIACNAAEFYGSKIGIFTMEMSAEEVLMRMISSMSGVPLENLFKGWGMNQNKIDRAVSMAGIISKMDIAIDDTGTNTPLELRAKTRRLKSEMKGLNLIIIDYLQLLTSSRRIVENRQQEMSEISRNLKILAKEMGVPVIALSQLNRELEKREDKTPRLSDLRESGAIEQDADIVMFIYRDEVYKPETEEKNVARIIVAKNRHGAIKTVKLRFQPETTSFDSLSQDKKADMKNF